MRVENCSCGVGSGFTVRGVADCQRTTSVGSIWIVTQATYTVTQTFSNTRTVQYSIFIAKAKRGPYQGTRWCLHQPHREDPGNIDGRSHQEFGQEAVYRDDKLLSAGHLLVRFWLRYSCIVWVVCVCVCVTCPFRILSLFPFPSFVLMFLSPLNFVP